MNLPHNIERRPAAFIKSTRDARYKGYDAQGNLWLIKGGAGAWQAHRCNAVSTRNSYVVGDTLGAISQQLSRLPVAVSAADPDRARVAREYERRADELMEARLWQSAEAACLMAADKWSDMARELREAGEHAMADAFRARADGNHKAARACVVNREVR